jgi:hypothetical protein
MNAQDNNIAPRDADLLASVDRVLARRDAATHGDSDSFETFCTELAAATPEADPAFRELLGRRLASSVEQRRERSAPPTRLRGFAARNPLKPHTQWRAARWRLTSLVLAATVAAGGIGAYLHGQGPTPVSAQVVLHRAEAVSPGPQSAAHSIYRISAGSGVTGTADAWIGTDASGAPTEFALTQTMLDNGKPAPKLSGRLVQTDRVFQVYDPATNTVTTSAAGRPLRFEVTSSSPSTPIQDLEGMFVGTLVAQKLSRAIDAGMHPNAFKLQQQTLDGVSVYALKIDDTASQTFYFNVQTYALEGADWVQGGRSWQARLDPAGYQTMPLSAVPAGTFTLNAPSTARVVTLSTPADISKRPGAGHDVILQSLASACNTTTQAIAIAMQAGGRSMLAVCQTTAPGITADSLVSALLVSFKANLDAQVSSGVLTADQEATDLANIRMKLTHMVADQPGSGTGTKQP